MALGEFKPLLSGVDLANIHESQARASLSSQQEAQLRQEQMQKAQEQKRLGALNQLSQLSFSNPEAMQQLAQADPERAKKNMDFLFQRSEREAMYAGVIDQAPRDKKAQVYSSVLKMARQDPLIDPQHIQNFPDEYSPELDSQFYSIAQSHRKLEDILKTQREQVDLQGERLSNQGQALQNQGYSLNNQKTKLELDNFQKTGGRDPEKQFKMTSELREKLADKSKDFVTVRNGYEAVQTSTKDPSAAGDLSLIFAYMKMLDPGSTVREGEFANAQNSGSIPETIRAKYNKAISGERLTQSQRNDFLNRASKIYTQSAKTQQKLVTQYADIAKRNNLPVEDVTLDFGTTIPQNSMPQISEGATATNPKTNEKIIFRGGKWQKI